MHNLYNIFPEEERDYIENFKSSNLSRENYIIPGLIISKISKRYEHYKSIFSKEKSETEYSDYIQSYSSESPEIILGSEYIKKLYEQIIKIRKLEEWDLSYFQLNFDTKREEVEIEIVKSFSNLEKVIKIYSSQDDDFSFHFQILTSNTKYDRPLMMKMLNIEYQLCENYRGFNLTFDYIPKIYDSEKEVVVKDASLIYQKTQKGAQIEFATSSFTTSKTQQATCKSPVPIAVTI